ncbi:hypothetical protein GOG27_06360 [Salmonella enterica subsp. arizonae]|nr:hypothetical protein [Salmonella enterica subsp. arizonae]
MNDVMTQFYFWFNLLLVSIVGLCIGSFLNVVVYRIPTSFIRDGNSLSIVFPPSHCPTCKHSIPARDNIPLFSYILLKGRCRFCHKKIHFLYPLTEVVSFIAFIIFYLLFYDKDWLLFFLSTFLFCLLYVISIIDLKFYIIPDKLLLILFLGGVVYSSMYGYVAYDILGIIFYTLIFAIIIFACDSFSDKPLIGMGDIKFYLSVVPWSGSLKFPLIMLTSSVAGLCFIIIWKLYVKNIYKPNRLTEDIDEKRFIPFGPAIAIATLIIFLVDLL